MPKRLKTLKKHHRFLLAINKTAETPVHTSDPATAEIQRKKNPENIPQLYLE
jgi:hypothetical protein